MSVLKVINKGDKVSGLSQTAVESACAARLAAG